jgi:RIO-like serine/threonine protein kinase
MNVRITGDKKMIHAFNGPELDTKDNDRLSKQHETIRALMSDHEWRTLAEIEQRLGYPQASISAQLRHLRKTRFGGYIVERRRRHAGTYEYRVLEPVPVGANMSFAF